MSLLLRSNADVNAQDPKKNTPLIQAILQEEIKAVKVLIKNKADLTLKGGDASLTPLQWAIFRNNSEIIKILAENGINVNQHSLEQKSPAAFAASLGSLEALKELFDRGANLYRTSQEEMTVLETAVGARQLQSVQELLRRISLQEELKQSKLAGTMLHRMAYEGSPEILKALLQFGFEVDTKNHENETPLHIAAAFGNFECVKVLLEYGANINEINKKGKIPLDLTGDEKIKKLLQEYKGQRKFQRQSFSQIKKSKK